MNTDKELTRERSIIAAWLARVVNASVRSIGVCDQPLEGRPGSVCGEPLTSVDVVCNGCGSPARPAGVSRLTRALQEADPSGATELSGGARPTAAAAAPSAWALVPALYGFMIVVGALLPWVSFRSDYLESVTVEAPGTDFDRGLLTLLAGAVVTGACALRAFAAIGNGAYFKVGLLAGILSGLASLWFILDMDHLAYGVYVSLVSSAGLVLVMAIEVARSWLEGREEWRTRSPSSWLSRGLILPVAVGVALGFEPSVYLLGSLLGFAFLSALLRRHAETRAMALLLHASAAVAAGGVAFAWDDPSADWTVVVLVATFIGAAVLFALLASHSLARGLLLAQMVALLALPLLGAAAWAFFGDEFLVEGAMTYGLVALALLVSLSPDALDAAFGRGVQARLRARYVPIPKPLEVPQVLQAISVAGVPWPERWVVLLVNPAIVTFGGFHRAAVRFFNACIQTSFQILDGGIRFMHQVLLRFLEAVGAYLRSLPILLRGALVSLRQYARVVGLPGVLFGASLGLVAGVSQYTAQYVGAEDGFSPQGWTSVLLMLVAIIVASVSSIAAASLLLVPSSAVWRSAGNFLPEQAFFAILCFWATSMLAIVAPAVTSRVGVGVASPYDFGPATLLASVFLGITMLYGLLRIRSHQVPTELRLSTN